MARKKKKARRPRTGAVAPETASAEFLKRDVLFIIICFFLSGIAGLVYEVLWVKMFGKVIGSTPLAVASVLTVFMAGLALGSYIASRKVDRVRSRGDLLWFYGLLECGIGVYGLLLPFWIKSIYPLYVLLYGQLFTNFWLYNLCSFVVCSVLLLPPVLMMGATLPVLSRFFVRQLSHLGRHVGVLYGVNTIGAAVGVILAGFFIIEQLGMWGTIVAVACVNLGVGVACAVLGKLVPRFQLETAASSTATTPEDRPAGLTVQSRGHIRLALAIFALSGFCAMAYQVIWTRLLGLLIAPTTYAFSLVVGTFIVGLAIGNVLFGRLADRVKDLMSLLALTQIAAAGFGLAASQLLGSSQFFFAKLLFTLQDSFGEAMIIQFLVLFFILFWPTLFLGATFPIVNKIYATSLSSLGKSIGRAYAVNTVGAVLGSFAAGFILIPFWGKEGSLSALVGIQAALALFVLGVILKGQSKKSRLGAALGAAGIACIALAFVYPHWNRGLLSYGRYQIPAELTPSFRSTGWLASVWRGEQILARQQQGREVVFYGDGIGGFTTVEKHIDSMGTIRYTMLNSGKPDATSHDDAATQALLAHIPLMFHPAPANVMILGLGSGMTAGEALHYPVALVDVLEINEQVIEAAQFFNDWNNHFAWDPRIRIIVQDGRNHLLLSRMSYDVVISEPSNPWMAGMANLYTQESFETIRDRLKDDGIFIQWVNAERMDWRTLAMIGRTFSTVFPNSVMMVSPIGGADFFFVGIKGNSPLRLSVANRNLDYAARSKIMSLADARQLFHLILTDRLSEMFADGVMHTDNRPYLEFAAPRHIYASSRGFRTILKQRSRISPDTASIITSSRDLDMILNMAELATSLYTMQFPPIDLSGATPQQLARYRDLVRGFCAKRVVGDYTTFYDDGSRETCAEVQTAYIKRYLADAPNNGSAWGDLGVVYARRSNLVQAEKAFERYIAAEPEAPSAYFRMGVLQVMKKDYSRAHEQFLKTVSLSPGHLEALLYLAKLNLLNDDKAAAAKYLERILENDDHPEARALLTKIEQDR